MKRTYRTGRATRCGICPHCCQPYAPGSRLVVVATVHEATDVIHAVGHRTPAECLQALLRARRAA